MLVGPDVSEHQGDVSWALVAGEHDFAIVRVADGDRLDRFYNRARVDALRGARLLFAPYHFGRVASPKNRERRGGAEAVLAIDQAHAGGWRWPGDLPLAYDFETNNGQPLDKCARHLVEFVSAYQELEGTYPLLYTAPSFWRSVAAHLSPADRELVHRCPLWLAHWGVSSPDVPEPWDHATLWQYTNSGSTRGITGPVDLNRCEMDAAQLGALASDPGDTPAPEPEPIPSPGERPTEWDDLWEKPWRDEAMQSEGFRDWLWQQGRLSPHFSRQEARCHDPARTPVPQELRAAAQRHAFNLERLRHRLGDEPLSVLSWYRTPAWNAHVGGAPRSRHMEADATDFSRTEIARHGGFDAAADEVFAEGGFGTYPSGARHVDSRGTRARWSSF